MHFATLAILTALPPNPHLTFVISCCSAVPSPHWELKSEFKVWVWDGAHKKVAREFFLRFERGKYCVWVHLPIFLCQCCLCRLLGQLWWCKFNVVRWGCCVRPYIFVSCYIINFPSWIEGSNFIRFFSTIVTTLIFLSTRIVEVSQLLISSINLVCCHHSLCLPLLSPARWNEMNKLSSSRRDMSNDVKSKHTWMLNYFHSSHSYLSRVWEFFRGFRC